MFTARLADFVCSTPLSQIPEGVLRRVGMALVDTVGEALAGSGEAVVNVALERTATFGGPGDAIVLGYDLRLAAAGRILGLDPQRMCIAFGCAAASAACLLKSFDTMAKSWQVGRAAQNGFLAAWLARQGGDRERCRH